MRAYCPQSNIKARKAEIVKEVQRQLPDYYRQVFRECAEDVMQQAVAAAIITLDKCYGWKRKRLYDYMKNLQMILETMTKPTEITSAWSNDDNIKYLMRYGIDIRKEFKAEVNDED